MYITPSWDINPLATYTDEFEWEEIYRGAEDLDALVERVKTQTKSTRKRKREVTDDDAEPGVLYTFCRHCNDLYIIVGA